MARIEAGGSLSPDVEIEEVELRPDNASLKPVTCSGASGDVRLIAEFVAVVG
jgi:hypothetical protein